MQTDGIETVKTGDSAVAPDWKTVSTPRINAKPLRFRGARRSHVTACGQYITLWQRKAGGYVVAWTTWQGEGLVADSHRAPDVAAAAHFLEDQCPQPWDRDRFGAQSELSMSLILEGLRYQNSFPLLVARALKDWARNCGTQDHKR